MSQVDQISHDWHHCRIYHADGYTPAAVRRQQIIESLRKRNLNVHQVSNINFNTIYIAHRRYSSKVNFECAYLSKMDKFNTQ